jgi:hypothetical protein
MLATLLRALMLVVAVLWSVTGWLPTLFLSVASIATLAAPSLKVALVMLLYGLSALWLWGN